MNHVLWSKNSDEWETPQDFFDKLNEEFDFQLDACATRGNAKCVEYYSYESLGGLGGLAAVWGNKRVWCNPPYSRVKDWVRKALEESMENEGGYMCCWSRRERIRSGSMIMFSEKQRYGLFVDVLSSGTVKIVHHSQAWC